MKIIKGNKVILNQNNSWMKDPTIKFSIRSHSKYGIRHYVYSIYGDIELLSNLKHYLDKYNISHKYSDEFGRGICAIEIESKHIYINK